MSDFSPAPLHVPENLRSKMFYLFITEAMLNSGSAAYLQSRQLELAIKPSMVGYCKWTDKQTDKWVDKQIDRQMDEEAQTNRKTDSFTRQTNKQTDKWINKQTKDGQTNRQTDKWTNEQTIFGNSSYPLGAF